MEQETNTGHICAVCSEDRRLSWQQHHEHLVLKEGDFVKVKLEYDENTEWMWAEITQVLGHSDIASQNTYFNGRLRNDGLLIPARYDDSISFFRTDVADYCKQGDFDNYDPWLPSGKHLHESRA